MPIDWGNKDTYNSAPVTQADWDADYKPNTYSGAANVIGNVSGSTDLAKSYGDFYNSTRNDSNRYSQLNTWGDNKGNVYDTTKMTPQQIFALSLNKDSNPNATAVLKGMGLDMSGNPTSPTNYSVNGSGGSGSYSLGSSATSTPTVKTGEMVPNNQGSVSNPSVSATGYEKDPTIDSWSKEAQLRWYAANPDIAKQEIQRAKGVYDANPNDSTKQADAHGWASDLRDALAKNGIDLNSDATYGNAAPTPVSGGGTVTTGGAVTGTGGKGAGVGTGTGTGAGTGLKTGGTGYPNTNLGDVNAVIGGNDKLTGALWDFIQQTSNNMFDRNSALAQQQKALADQQAQVITNQKLAQYKNLTDSLETGQRNDLQNVSNSVDNAKSSIEDKSFQDWLQARQDAASRGLGSSGIAGDANTRLLLAKQHDLANMYTQKQGAANDINKNYADKLAAARTEIANTNQGQTAAQLFNQMFSDSSNKSAELAKMFGDIFKTQMGYSQANPKDVLDYQGKNNQTAGRYEAAIAKLNSTAQIEYAKMAQKYQTDMTKIMGVDDNGNLTLDAKNLLETVRHNTTTEGITATHNAATTAIAQMNANVSAGNLKVNQDRLKETIDHNVAQMDLEISKFNDSQTIEQAKVLYESAQTAQGEANSAIKMKSDYMMNNYGKAGTPEYKDKLDGYDKAIIDATTKIDNSSTAMQEIVGLKKSGVIGKNSGSR